MVDFVCRIRLRRMCRIAGKRLKKPSGEQSDRQRRRQALELMCEP
jgi:hypothetical protein